ncbi:MAG: hypothetical protein R2710_15750 [Acidimicrobiales bacterium]
MSQDNGRKALHAYVSDAYDQWVWLRRRARRQCRAILEALAPELIVDDEPADGDS